MNNMATTVTGGSHGTKWLGILTIASSVLSGLDPSVLPPSWLPYIGTGLGLLTLARGFINTQSAMPPKGD
jgi:hypothetical protein